MTIDVSEDLDEVGGYAFIRLGRPLSMPFRISIRRLDAEPRHLGAEDWQSEVAWLEPRSITREPESTIVRVGPEIVDRIEELVRIEIVVEGEQFGSVVTWPAITPSPGIEGSLALQGAPSAPKVLESDLLTVVAAAVKAEVANIATDSPATIASQATFEQTKIVLEQTSVAAAAPVRRRFGWMIAGVVCIGAVAAGAIFAFGPVWQRPQGEPRREPGGPTVGEITRKLESLLRRSAESAAFVTLGSEALAAGHPAVAFRAFEAADPYASPDAALQLAKFYDPRSSESGSAATPNAARAITYYALWKNRSPTHTTELKALCAAYANLVAGNDRLQAACRD